MPSWWSKSSSKDSNEKSKKGSLINTIHKKFRIVSEGKCKSGSGSSKKHSDAKHAFRPPISPYMQASLCKSFAERPQPLPLPLPGPQHSAKHRANSGKKEVAEAEVSKGSQPVLFSPLPKPPNRPDPVDAEAAGGTSSVSSDKSTDVDNPSDSRLPSPHASGYKNAKKAALNSSSSVTKTNQSPNSMRKNSREMLKPTDTILNNQVPTSHKPDRASSYVPNLQIPHHGTSFCAPDSTMCSPSRSSVRAGKPCADLPMPESGHCSSPGSGHNSVGGDLVRFSPQYSPIPSPRMTSPGPSSRIHSEAVTPFHPRAGGTIELPAQWPDGNHQGQRLPLPPINISNTNRSYATETTLVPRSPSRVKNPTNCGPRWKKGKLLGRGTFGHVYLGFDSENGEMCAMKEVTLFSDDAKSKESAQQLGQVYDKLYIYLEYVSGGSIYKILQDFKLREAAIRRFTRQILSGLAYLHDRHTIHRDIKAANLLLEPNGCVKLADFGMAKLISDESYKLSFKGSSYWIAPEIILNNSNGRNLAVDIWSLGCTVWEMATGKPPWSELEAVAALYKIGYSEKLPEIPQHLSDDGKDFIRRCLQRNPLDRSSAAQLLEHPFVKNAAPPERPMPCLEPSETMPSVEGYGHARNLSLFNTKGAAIQNSEDPKLFPAFSDAYVPRNIPSTVSQITSSVLHPLSPQGMSPRPSESPILSPQVSGSSTPVTGGGGAIPFHLSKQPPHEGMGITPMSQKPELFPGPSKAYHIYQEVVQS